MYAGEIVESGPMEELFHQPRHPYTRLLFAATPDLYGDEAVTSIPGTPPRLDLPLKGCPFALRCDSTFEPFPDVRPLLARVGPPHLAACHLHDHAYRPAAAGGRPASRR